MASDAQSRPAALSWKDRFVDARFSAEEATEWEQLVASGWSRDDATEELLTRRRGDGGSG